MELQRLESDRFLSSSLDGKLANICADLPASELKGSSAFKSITGGDRITAERKYHDSYDMQPYCKADLLGQRCATHTRRQRRVLPTVDRGAVRAHLPR